MSTRRRRILCLTTQHDMTYGGVEIQLQAFLTSAQGGVELSASRLSWFSPVEGSPGTHWTGG